MLLSRVSGTELVSEAKGDIEASVTHLFTDPPQCGLSKWASLQAIEKLIKADIKKKRSTPRRSHNLTDLAIAAESLGLPQLPRELLDRIQCEAGVRYGDPAVTVQEAVVAN